MKTLANTIIIGILLLIMSHAQASANGFHNILGADNWGWTEGKVVIVHEEKDWITSKPIIRLVQDMGNNDYHLEVDGDITASLVSKVIDIINEVKPLNKYATIVYLNSAGGDALEGLRLGRHFRQTGVSARVTKGQICASSCAFAFVGGRFRHIEPEGIVQVHAPYFEGKYGVSKCIGRYDAEAKVYKTYTTKMLGTDGAYNFNKDTFNTCSKYNLVSYDKHTSWIQAQ